MDFQPYLGDITRYYYEEAIDGERSLLRGALAMKLAAIPAPLREDEHGVIRVANTRIPFDTVLDAFHAGATAEEIAQQYPALDLATVYAVIAFYLQNRDEVEQYMADRRQAAEEIRRRWDSRTDQAALRARLLSRRETSA